MHSSMQKHQHGSLIYYTCDRLPVPHAFSTKHGGVSTGVCASLNFGIINGDTRENVHQNFQILADALGLPKDRMTLTKQVHACEISNVTEETVGAGLHFPQPWESDALITNLSNTPIMGFYADCIVTLLYDPVQQVCATCHSGWRGVAGQILPKTIARMTADYGSNPADIIAVMGPSICKSCFETDADVPDAMREALGDVLDDYLMMKGVKYHLDLQGINLYLLKQAGLSAENCINSGICTMCNADEFWSHRATKGLRGVQTGMICLR